MNRIEQKFKSLKKQKKKAFIVFLTAGYPTLKTTEELVLAFEKSGVDIVELGIPFSDPLADGPVIQASSNDALSHHVTLKSIFDCVTRIRKKSEIPIALMTYYNPIFHLGENQFAQKAHRAGVDGVIVPDLPPDEAKALMSASKQNNLSTVFFLSPTTTKARMKNIVNASSGFVYYVSLTGVTGARRALPSNMVKNIRAAKSLTDKPVCVGFGVSTPAQVKRVGQIADGVIVGSVVIQEITKNIGRRDLAKRVAQFVSRLAKNL